MTPRLVAIFGHSRHGKDEAAKYLECRYGYTRYMVSSPLAAASSALFGWAPDWADAHKDEIDPHWGLSPRQAQQAIGREFVDVLSSLFPEFARVTGRRMIFRRLMDRMGGESLAVVTGRFLLEDETALRAMGAVFIRVWRPGVPVDLSHESERSVSTLAEDAMADNSGTIEDLHRELDRIMHSLGGLVATRKDCP